MIYCTSRQGERLYQGELVSDLIEARLDPATLGTDSPALNLEKHPFAVVLAQDCDLESDFMRRTGQRDTGSQLRSVLFCEVATADELKASAEIKSDI